MLRLRSRQVSALSSDFDLLWVNLMQLPTFEVIELDKQTHEYMHTGRKIPNIVKFLSVPTLWQHELTQVWSKLFHSVQMILLTLQIC